MPCPCPCCGDMCLCFGVLHMFLGSRSLAVHSWAGWIQWCINQLVWCVCVAVGDDKCAAAVQSDVGSAALAESRLSSCQWSDGGHEPSSTSHTPCSSAHANHGHHTTDHSRPGTWRVVKGFVQLIIRRLMSELWSVTAIWDCTVLPATTQVNVPHHKSAGLMFYLPQMVGRLSWPELYMKVVCLSNDCHPPFWVLTGFSVGQQHLSDTVC